MRGRGTRRCPVAEPRTGALCIGPRQVFGAQAFEIIGDKRNCLAYYEHAADLADSLDLVPTRLAASDRIEVVRGIAQGRELRKFLTAEGVKNPEKFAHIYSGLC